MTSPPVQGTPANQLEAGMGALRVHFGENFQIINRNVRRIGIMPPRAIGAAQQAAQQQQPDRMGELSPFPHCGRGSPNVDSTLGVDQPPMWTSTTRIYTSIHTPDVVPLRGECHPHWG
jgi:hypothetical protein